MFCLGGASERSYAHEEGATGWPVGVHAALSANSAVQSSCRLIARETAWRTSGLAKMPVLLKYMICRNVTFEDLTGNPSVPSVLPSVAAPVRSAGLGLPL